MRSGKMPKKNDLFPEEQAVQKYGDERGGVTRESREEGEEHRTPGAEYQNGTPRGVEGVGEREGDAEARVVRR